MSSLRLRKSGSYLDCHLAAKLTLAPDLDAMVDMRRCGFVMVDDNVRTVYTYT